MKINTAKVLEEKLNKYLEPSYLNVRDDSHKHQGHAGWSKEGQSHFHITVISDKFNGCSKIDRHRMVNKILEEEITVIHALSIKASTSSEIG
ncbi:MAG: BolA family protein [Alphaproteobacteria bacterium]|jgi:BolA protein|nr:BolA family transcriptional regulator [Hyphomicrobiales bacterium]|tara:strand:- start:22589 stop:22864 length:276 start_codon:yes stop_codon:yes gene_type:complete